MFETENQLSTEARRFVLTFMRAGLDSRCEGYQLGEGEGLARRIRRSGRFQ